MNEQANSTGGIQSVCCGLGVTERFAAPGHLSKKQEALQKRSTDKTSMVRFWSKANELTTCALSILISLYDGPL